MQDKCPFCNAPNGGEKDDLIRCTKCNKPFEVGNIEMRKQIAKKKRALVEKNRLETATKPCPFCAETIKALAVKCKHCGSDLNKPDVKAPETKKVTIAPKKKTIVKSYVGKISVATEKFQKDAEKLAEKGYNVKSQVFTPGTWGCGAFLVALVLCFAVIGLIAFIYMLLVKPAGELTVTYKWEE